MTDMVADRNAIAELEAALEWLRFTHPISAHFGAEVRRADLSRKRLACWMHLLPDTILTLMPFVEAGVSVRVGGCNPDSTDPRVVAYLASHGVEVFDGRREPRVLYDETLRRFATGPLDAICDMGGELIEAATLAGTPIAGALEATTTGLHRIRPLTLAFPVFDWNGIALKDAIHNRFHVGEETWPAFGSITGLSLFGCRVLVVGFGPVGRGVAERARALGAVVTVAERDPVRQLEALHFGCRTLPLAEAVAEAAVIVTATGRDGVLGEAELSLCRDGAVLFNVGHSNREIDVDWLDLHEHRTMRAHIERYAVGGRSLFLLNRGSLINIAFTGNLAGSASFDPFSSVMIRGLLWLLSDGAAGIPPGLHNYPPALEREVATAALAVRARA
ncbi:S-adenosyl-L-homocysteine hydrolase [Devosia insulae DS-56]|uniref:S-adenosyl-L-homocysteine hydrolase n=2 Tax=Devosia insulae TaxID=408174 RepID=A0A1E5XWJ1_9HYPH|nr:S-adenosyl-L-homocysteine hydrolase [Devosia insulae DS-56]